MQIIQARVDGQVFILTAGQDIEVLKGKIIAAVRAGADFVDFDTVGRSMLSVMITPTIPVRFEILDRSQEQVEEWEENPPSLDAYVDADTYLSTLDN